MPRFNGIPLEPSTVEDVPVEQGDKKPRFAGIPAKSSALRRFVGDPLVGLARGVVALPEAAIGFLDLGVGTMVSTTPMLPTLLGSKKWEFGHVGKAMQSLGFDFKATKEILNAELLSPEVKKSMATVEQAQGFIENVVAYAKHPDVVAQIVAESAPSMLGGAGAARKLITVFPKLSPAMAAAIGEGVISAGSQAEANRRESETGLITKKQAGLAATTGVMTAIISQIGGRAASKLGIEDVDVLLTKGASIKVKRGILSRVIGGALVEGGIEEAPQSAVETMADNVANGRPIGTGIEKAIVAGLYAGGIMGSGANVPGPIRGSSTKPTAADVAAWAAENPEAARKLAASPDPTSRKAANAAGLPQMNKESRAAFAEELKKIEIPAAQPPPIPANWSEAVAEYNAGLGEDATQPPPIPEQAQLPVQPEVAPQSAVETVPEGSPADLAEKANPERFFVANEDGTIPPGAEQGFETEDEAVAFMSRSPEADAVVAPLAEENKEPRPVEAGPSAEEVATPATQAKAPELMTPDEYEAAFPAKYGNDEIVFSKGLRTVLKEAYEAKRPVSARSAESMAAGERESRPLAIPPGYVRDGDLYVFNGEQAPAVVPKAEAAEVKPKPKVSAKKIKPIPQDLPGAEPPAPVAVDQPAKPAVKATIEGVAGEYGYSMRDGQLITPSGKDTGVVVESGNKGRMMVRGKGGKKLFSFPASKPEAIGEFLEKYWYAAKKPVASPVADAPAEPVQENPKVGLKRKRKSTDKVDPMVEAVRSGLRGRIRQPKKGEPWYAEVREAGISPSYWAKADDPTATSFEDSVKSANQWLEGGREIHSGDELIAMLKGKLPPAVDADAAYNADQIAKEQRRIIDGFLEQLRDPERDGRGDPDEILMYPEEYQIAMAELEQAAGLENSDFEGMGADVYSKPDGKRSIGKIDPVMGKSKASDTGTKKEYVTNEMMKRWGIDINADIPGTSNDQMIAEANALLQSNPNEGSDLVKMMQEAPFIPTYPQRIAMLYETTVREQAFNSAREKGDREAIKRADESLQEMYYAVREGSRQWGLAGRAMQMLMDEAYSVTHMVAVREAAIGRKLNESERAEEQMKADDYKKLKKEFEDALAKREAELAGVKDKLSEVEAELESKRQAEVELNKAVAEVRRAEADQDALMQELQAVKGSYDGLRELFRKASQGVGKNRLFTEERGRKISSAADAARERMRMRAYSFSAGIDPAVLADIIEIGADFIYKGAAFVESMIREYGEGIKPHLKMIEERSLALLERNLEEDAKVPEPRPADRQKNATKKARQGGMTVKKMVRHQVEAGVFDLDTILKNVQAIIRQVGPVDGLSGDPSIREIRDKFSGYGKPISPSKDPIEVALLRLRTKSQKLSQLDDLLKGIQPKKSGQQRLESTPEERELARKVRKLMKELGFSTRTSEAQMKSAVDAAKTRMNNAIEDLERAMRTGERIQKVKAGVELDADGKALKARLDEMKAEYADIFFDETPKKTMAERRKTVKENLGKRIAALRRQILDGARTDKAGLRPVSDMEITRMKAEESALKDLLDKYLPETDKYADQKAESAKRESLSREIQSLNDQINSKTQKAVGKKDVADSPEVASLKAIRDSKRAILNEMFPKAPLTPDEQMELAERAAERNAEFWEKRLAKAQAGEKVGKRQASSPWSPSISEAKQRVLDAKKAIQAIEDAINPPPTEIMKELKRAYDRTERMIQKGKEKIASGDFGPKPYKRPINLSDHPDLLQKKMELEKVKTQIHIGQAKYRYDSMSTEEKAKFIFWECWDVARNTAGSIDLSALGRQGWFYAFTHPVQWAKTFSTAKAITATEAQRQYEQFQEMENYRNGVFDAMKVAFNKADGTGNFTNAEDNYRLNLTRKIPVLGLTIDASNRLYATAINQMRAGFADLILRNSEMGQQIMKNPRSLTAEQRQFLLDIGQGVNILTGRGNLKGAETWARFGWAPRFVKSTFDFLSAKPIRSAKSKEAKIIFAKQYARLAMTLGAIYGVALAMGGGDDEDGRPAVEFDPRSSNFGAIRLWGNYYWNPIAVVKPQLVFLARLVSGQTKVGQKVVKLRDYGLPFATDEEREGKVPYGAGMMKTITRFLQSKAHPTAGAILSGFTGKAFDGKDFTFAGALMDATLPLTPRMAYESFSTTDPGTAAAMTIMEGLGFEVNADYNDFKVMRYQAKDEAEFIKKLEDMDLERMKSMWSISGESEQAFLRPYLEKKLGNLIWSATDADAKEFDKDAVDKEIRKLRNGGPMIPEFRDIARATVAERATNENARLLKKRAEMMKEVAGMTEDEAVDLMRRYVVGKGDSVVQSTGGKLTPYGRRIATLRKVYREMNENNF